MKQEKYHFSPANPCHVSPHSLGGIKKFLVVGQTDEFFPAFDEPWFPDMNGPGHDALVRHLELTRQEQWIDLYGHGGVGLPLVNFDKAPLDTLSSQDWIDIGKYRASHGLSKFILVEFHMCNVIRDPAYVDAVLTAAGSVGGYKGWSVNPKTGQPGWWYIYNIPPRATWTSKMNFHGSRGWFRDTIEEIPPDSADNYWGWDFSRFIP